MKPLLLLYSCTLLLLLTGAAAPPAKYKQKEPVVEAIQWDGANLAAVTSFMAPAQPLPLVPPDATKFFVETLEGRKIATPTDWIIKIAPGAFDVQKNAEFTLKNEVAP